MTRRSSSLPLILFLLLVIAVLGVSNLILLKRKPAVVKPEATTVIKEVVKIVEKPAPPPPLPQTFVASKEVRVADLFNGIRIETKADFPVGRQASIERVDKNSYVAEFKVRANVPAPATKVEELTAINPSLVKILPALPEMLAAAKVSGFYHKLYENKTQRIQRDFTLLNRALDRHNFYDLETILELTSPATQQKVLLIQSEMDVVSDGSDGDRMATMDEKILNSSYYQPFTSYGWPKATETPNPLLAVWEERLKKKEAEYKQPGLSKTRNNELQSDMRELKSGIADMKRRSFLIADKDPFVVMSLAMLGYPAEQFGPAIGDYVAVIYNDVIYPALIGDGGPTFKMGEASLFMAQTLNPKATPNIRPVNDLKVTYLVFPGSAEQPFSAPDLVKWREKVQALLDKIGGLGPGVTLYEWQSPFAVK